MVFLTQDQVDDLAAAIGPRYEMLVRTAALAGMRQGELFALTTADLDLPRGRITVTKSLNDLGHELVVGPTKTRQSRTVRIPLHLAEALASHIERFPGPNGLLFTSSEGTLIRRSNFLRRHFHPAVEDSGIPSDTRFHDLRHTCAAILIDRGWSLEQLKRHLGHSSIRVTSDRYAHLYEGHDDDLMDALDRDLRARPHRPRPAQATVTMLRTDTG